MRYMLNPPRVPGFEGDLDELFKEAVEVVVQCEGASAALLQRRLSIGYARAARLIDQLEEAGVVGYADGSKPGEVLIDSSEEILGPKDRRIRDKQKDVFGVPNDYKIPTDVKLSCMKKQKWGKQLSDVIGSKDYKHTDVEYPIILGFDDKEKLVTTGLSKVNNCSGPQILLPVLSLFSRCFLCKTSLGSPLV